MTMLSIGISKPSLQQCEECTKMVLLYQNTLLNFMYFKAEITLLCASLPSHTHIFRDTWTRLQWLPKKKYIFMKLLRSIFASVTITVSTYSNAWLSLGSSITYSIRLSSGTSHVHGMDILW